MTFSKVVKNSADDVHNVLNFSKTEGLNTLHGILNTLPKVAYCPAYKNTIIENGFTVPLLKYKHLNLKLRML